MLKFPLIAYTQRIILFEMDNVWLKQTNLLSRLRGRGGGINEVDIINLECQQFTDDLKIWNYQELQNKKY